MSLILTSRELSAPLVVMTTAHPPCVRPFSVHPLSLNTYRPSLQEGQPQDPDALAAWPWWKAKKWVLHITYRLFNRYGDPKAGRSGADGDFIVLFSQQCSLKFLEAHMKLMASYSQVRQMYVYTSEIRVDVAVMAQAVLSLKCAREHSEVLLCSSHLQSLSLLLCPLCLLLGMA